MGRGHRRVEHVLDFGEEFEPIFYESYGIMPDPVRIRFFRLLYDLVS